MTEQMPEGREPERNCPDGGKPTEVVSYLSDAPGRRRITYTRHVPVNGFRVYCDPPRRRSR